MKLQWYDFPDCSVLYREGCYGPIARACPDGSWTVKRDYDTLSEVTLDHSLKSAKLAIQEQFLENNPDIEFLP